MKSTDQPDRFKLTGTVTIPEGMTVEEVNEAARAVSAAREAARAEREEGNTE